MPRSILLPIAAVGLVFVLGHKLPSWWGNILFDVLFYAVLGQSWNLLGGYARQTSLGHAAFVGAGAYTCVVFLGAWQAPLAVGLLAAAFMGGLLGTFFGILVSFGRLRGVSFTLVSILLAEILRRLMDHAPFLGGTLGLSLTRAGGLADNLSSRCTFVAAALFLATWCCVRFRTSRFGLRLRLFGLSEDLAEATGVPVAPTICLAAAASGCLAGFAGAVFSLHLGYVHPDLLFGLHLSVMCAVIAVLGGRGFAAGPLLGAAILVPVLELSRTLVVSGQGGLQLVVSGLVMAGAAAFFPGGVWGVLSPQTAAQGDRHDPSQ